MTKKASTADKKNFTVAGLFVLVTVLCISAAYFFLAGDMASIVYANQGPTNYYLDACVGGTGYIEASVGGGAAVKIAEGDDFNDGDYTNWNNWSGTWSAANGYLEKTNTDSNGVLGKYFPEFNNELLISYRCSDVTTTDFCYVRFLTAGSDAVLVYIYPSLIEMKEYVSGQFVQTDSETITTTQDAWYDLKVVVDGGNVTVWRGPKGGALTQILTMSGVGLDTQTWFSLGLVGNTNIHYQFDDFSISSTQAYSSGTTVSVDANAPTGNSFDGWTGDLTGTTTPQNLLMNASKSVTADFHGGLLTINVTGSGTTIPTPGTHGYPVNTQVSIAPIPAVGWIFDHWEDDLSGSTIPGSITMASDKTVTAVFTQSSGGGGTTPTNSYRFEAGAGAVLHDSSGNGYGGTIYGATWVQDTPTGVGNALSFDGTDDYVHIDGNYYTSEMTISAWVKVPSPLVGAMSVVEVAGNAVTERAGILISDENGGRIYLVHHDVYRYWDGLISTDEWVHITAVFTASTLDLYLDGTLASGGSTASNALDADSDDLNTLYIGRNVCDTNAGSAFFFDGIIDDVEVCESLSTPVAVSKGYKAANEIGKWKLRGGSGSYVYDSVTNGNDGELQGSPVWDVDENQNTLGLIFDGIDDYVKVPDTGTVDLYRDALTISAWVKLGDLSGSNCSIIEIAGSAATNTERAGIVFTEEDEELWLVHHHKGTSWDRSAVLRGGEWIHIAAVMDDSSFNLYINGEDMGSGSTPITATDADSANKEQLYMGRSVLGSGNEFYFNGTIGEVALYQVALEDRDVKRLANHVFTEDNTPIQNVIDGAYPGTRVVVHGGTYDENPLKLVGERVSLAFYPDDTEGDVISVPPPQ